MNDRWGQPVIWPTLRWNSAFEGGAGRPNECLHRSQKWNHTAPFFAFGNCKVQITRCKLQIIVECCRFDMSQVPPASFCTGLRPTLWAKYNASFDAWGRTSILSVHAVCQTPLLMHRCFVLALNLSFRQAQIRFKNTFDAKEKSNESATSKSGKVGTLSEPSTNTNWLNDFRTLFIYLKNDWHLSISSGTGVSAFTRDVCARACIQCIYI